MMPTRTYRTPYLRNTSPAAVPARISSRTAIFGADFFQRLEQRLALDVPRHDDQAVVVGQHQIARLDSHAANLDRHVDGRDALPVQAVARTGAASKDGESHFVHFSDVAHGAVDDRAGTASVARPPSTAARPTRPSASSRRPRPRARRPDGIRRPPAAPARRVVGRARKRPPTGSFWPDR